MGGSSTSTLLGCGVMALSEFGMQLLVAQVVIVVAGAIIVAGAVRVGVQSLVVDSPQELISANDITTPSIILEMFS